MSFTVVDLFCGCGGISQGFSLAGFNVIFGLDNNKDAITSFAHNFPNATTLCKKIEDLEDEDIPKADIIVGGPPCVNFSSSKGSRANVLEGLKLVQLFLKFVYQRKPKYWLMENVPRIGLHLPEQIPLKWLGIDEDGFLEVPTKKLFDIWEYGAPQKRSRLLIGNFPTPEPTHCVSKPNEMFTSNLDQILTLGDIIKAFPNPLTKVKDSIKTVCDPIYRFNIPAKSLDDHFYDSRMSKKEWESIKDVKVNHPFMGRMDFPDDPNKLARTVVSLQMGRETLVIQHDSDYRRLTIRECASIQTFPISFKFAGKTIESRYRQAGNAVPPILTYNIAKYILELECIEIPPEPVIFIPQSLEKPIPRKSKQRRIDYSRQRTILFPGKEIRGFRIELTSSFVDVVRWTTQIHVGEGKASHKIFSFAQDNVIHYVEDNLKAFGGESLGIYRTIKNEISKLDFCSGDSLHRDLHDKYGVTPEWFNSIIRIFDYHLPKEKWSRFDIPIVKDDIEINRKKIRIRLLVGLSIAKLVETKLNSSEIEQIQITA